MRACACRQQHTECVHAHAVITTAGNPPSPRLSPASHALCRHHRICSPVCMARNTRLDPDLFTPRLMHAPIPNPDGLAGMTVPEWGVGAERGSAHPPARKEP
eukprot:359346-Chlamydomonas_euryale.AAC.5